MTELKVGRTAAPPFEQFDDDDVRALIAEYPLAWVTDASGDSDEASLLPLIGRFDGDGRLVELIGHVTRTNPLHAALARSGRATILFNGPGGYVSPEHAGRRDWAPTWNYAQLRIRADIAFDDGLTDESLESLVAVMERGRTRPWHQREMGARYAALRRHVIGFRARVTRVTGRFKLGQDESADIFSHIVATLPDARLVAWMQRFRRSIA